MAVPALVFLYFNWTDPATARGWAIPTATDIAFALGVISLFGARVPASLKIFLAALAIIDDLGAVVVIAVFYTADLNLLALIAAAAVLTALYSLNRIKVLTLWPYLALGVALWVFLFASGVHATLAGVMLALTIPLKVTPGTPEASPSHSPLHKLEHMLHKPVAFGIVPIFGFANAGVSFKGVTMDVLGDSITMGIAAGLLFGKLIGVLGTVAFLVKLDFADLPAQASWGQMIGVALLCGIGFTMSLFIGLLAFGDPVVQDRVKIGILAGSVAAGALGAIFLGMFGRRERSAGLREQ
jgi:NhaA family Na+:H+ antiporter